jgi:hypothetical protein
VEGEKRRYFVFPIDVLGIFRVADVGVRCTKICRKELKSVSCAVPFVVTGRCSMEAQLDSLLIKFFAVG